MDVSFTINFEYVAFYVICGVLVNYCTMKGCYREWVEFGPLIAIIQFILAVALFPIILFALLDEIKGARKEYLLEEAAKND